MPTLPSTDLVDGRKRVSAPIEMSNREFLARYARPGCVGLACGRTLIDRAIAHAERHVDRQKCWGQWTHAFLFSERRLDQHLWIVESDLQIHKKHLQFGVQENRASKYEDGSVYTSLAVLDFGLSEEVTRQVAAAALDLVANRTRYSLRELVGTLIALKRPSLRSKRNLLERDECFYCSALVEHLFSQVGVSLTAGLDVKNTTPEDIARSPRPHIAYLLQREILSSRIQHIARKLKRKSPDLTQA